MKIIIFGCYAIEMRRQIEFFLDDECEIIGYTDEYMSEDILDGKKFIPLEKLYEAKFDYIVLALPNEDAKSQAINLLGAFGVVSKKVIYPEILEWSNNGKFQRDIITEIDEYESDEDIKALMMGLSYSRRGINEKRIGVKYFNYSCPGMDLYYNNKLLEYTIKNRNDIINKVKYVFLVMPYYYFDYDESATLASYYTGHISNLTCLNDFHNAEQIPATYPYIASFKMFARKIHKFYRSTACPQNRSIWEKENRGVLLGFWNRVYENVEKENRNIFSDILKMCNNNNWRLIVIIPPVFIRGLCEKSQKAFNNKKELFYSIYNEIKGNSEIWDFSENYSEKVHFDSYDHLNYFGSQIFSDDLNSKMLSENVR